jgi:hypothetical protein
MLYHALVEVYATIAQPFLSVVWDHILGGDERSRNINKWKGRALVTRIMPLSYFGSTCPNLGSTASPHGGLCTSRRERFHPITSDRIYAHSSLLQDAHYVQSVLEFDVLKGRPRIWLNG